VFHYLRIDLLIYFAAQLQECLINLLTYLFIFPPALFLELPTHHRDFCRRRIVHPRARSSDSDAFRYSWQLNDVLRSLTDCREHFIKSGTSELFQAVCVNRSVVSSNLFEQVRTI